MYGSELATDGNHNKRTVKPLSKESIQKICEAEEQAKLIREQAQARAREMYAETQEKSEADRIELEQRTERELRETLDSMRKRSEEILQRSLEEAQKNAEQMNKLAKTHMEEAVKAVVWGIREQCQ